MLLDIKTLAFCRYRAAGYSMRRAAVKAGFDPQTAVYEASKLALRPDVLEQIKSFQSDAESESAFTVAWLQREIADCYGEAREKKDLRNASKFLEMLGKTIGAFTQKVEIDQKPVHVRVDIEAELRRLSPAEREQIRPVLLKLHGGRAANADNGEPDRGFA